MELQRNKKALIIGSGIAGLASAIRLKNKGYEVHVFEANSYPGGKLAEIKVGGYRFDAGPSLFTMPQYIEELYQLSGRKTEDYFQYKKSEVACRYLFEDGIDLTFFADANQTLEEIRTKLDVDPNHLKKHFEKSDYIYKKTHKAFLEQSLHRFSNYISKAVLTCLLAAPKLHLFTSLHRLNKRKLNHEKLVRIFDRFATYNGSNPYQAPGILLVIPHLEHGFGTYFPEKGMRSIIDGMVRLCDELGVQFHFNARVEEICFAKSEVKGIKIDNKLLAGDIVLCNADINQVYGKLLPESLQPVSTKNQESSSSALIFYWGIKKKFEQLDLHNMLFSDSYEEEFQAIFKEGNAGADPSIYIHISSKMNPDDAPQGCENWFVMVNVACDLGQDWEAIRIRLRAAIIQKINRMLNVDLENLIEEERYLDPPEIERKTGSFRGALYGSSSNHRMSAFFRHSNKGKLKGLYFAGGSVHPGGGIPLCLLSAKISCEMITE